MMRRSLWVLGLLAVVGACTNNPNPDGPIDYSVTGGLNGQGDGTVLHIELDGRMSRPKAGGGTETATLAPATIQDLRNKIASADFATLAPMYSCNCADDFVYNISVHLDGETHRVAADGMAQVPAELGRVIDTLKQLAQAPHDWH